MLEQGWARRGAPETLVQPSLRSDPGSSGGCRHAASRRRCSGCSGARQALGLVSRDLRVTAAELSSWRDAFLAGGEASLKSRPADARDAEIGRLQAKVGELTMTTELLEAKIEHVEAHRPLAHRRSRPTPRSLLRGDPGDDEPAGLALHEQG